MIVRILCALVRVYQILVSPILHFIGGPGSGCRFDPTCSNYMIGALRSHGAGRGLWLGLRRVARCHPWGGFGHDPVPSARGCKSAATADNTRAPDGRAPSPSPVETKTPHKTPPGH